MDTFFAKNRLSSYLDGSLNDAEAAEVEAALSEDAGLRDEYDRMRRAVELLRSVGPTEAPAGFHARVMASVAAEPAPGGVVTLFRRTLGRVPVEALALAAAALLVVLVIQNRGGKSAMDEALRQDAPTASVLPNGSSTSLGEAQDAQASTSGEGTTAKDAAPPPPASPDDLNQAVAAAAPASADGDLRTATRVDTKLAPGELEKGASPARSNKSGATKEPYFAGWESQGDASLDAQAEGSPLTTAAADNSGALNTGALNTGALNTGALNTGPELVGGTPAALSKGIEMARPSAFRLSLTDPQVLYQLSSLAESAGGRLTDANGSTMRAHELSAEDAWVQVHIVVPRDSAAAIQQGIATMGGVPTPPPQDNLLYGSDYAVFVVSVSARR